MYGAILVLRIRTLCVATKRDQQLTSEEKNILVFTLKEYLLIQTIVRLCLSMSTNKTCHLSGSMLTTSVNITLSDT